MKTLYFVSLSGGKDSTATAIFMLKKYSIKKLRFVFADTGWEHPKTYEYLEYLKKVLDIKIIVVNSEKYKDMETLCITKKMFPSRINKFCTTELKILPIQKLYKEYQTKGYKIISVVGVRKEESKARSGEGVWKFNFFNINKKHYTKRLGVYIYQPIVNWTTQEVYNYHFENKIEMNPLYKMGCTRVGCYPCINANVLEKGLLENSAIEKIRKLENKIGKMITKRENATFFYEKGKPLPIDKVVDKHKYNSLEFDLGCINQYGLCE